MCAPDALATIDHPRLGVIRNRMNYGMVGNWNQCLHIPDTDWVTILHDDDMLGPAFLATLEPLLQRDHTLVCCETIVARENPPSWSIDASSGSVTWREVLFRGLCPFPGVLVRRAAVLAAGGFDPSMQPSADHEYWVRLLQQGPGLRNHSKQAFYRIGEQQASHSLVPQLINAKSMIYKRHGPSSGCPPALLYLIHTLSRWRMSYTYRVIYSKEPDLYRRSLSCRLVDRTLDILISLALRHDTPGIHPAPATTEHAAKRHTT